MKLDFDSYYFIAAIISILIAYYGYYFYKKHT